MSKDRDDNPEVRLALEVLQRLRGEKVLNPAHEEVSYNTPPQPSGSQNYVMIWLAAEALAGGKKLAQACTGFVAMFRAACSRSLPAGQSWGFMGTEAVSRIYSGLIAVPWIVALVHGHEQVRKMAREWLEFLIALCMISRAPNGRVLLVGQRSSDRPQPVFLDCLADVADGGKVNRWRKAGKWGRPEPNGSLEERTRAWDIEALAILAKHVRGLWKTRVDADPFTILAKSRLVLRTDFYWLHKMSGEFVACWTTETVNGNTAPMLAGAWIDGAIHWLPEGGGGHVRGKKGVPGEKATCHLDGNVLRYRLIDRHPKHNEPADLAIPPGQYMLTTSADGFQRRVVHIDEVAA